MMKTVREGGSEGWLGSGDGTGDDTAVEMAESQFSQAMAANGGLGLAHLIERDISHQQDGQNEKASAE
jgi:Rod binding domain-containing protein